MKKLKLYLETTVWNFLFSDTEIEKRNWTCELFSDIRKEKYDISISDVVLEEIRRAQYHRRIQIENAMQTYSPIHLEINDECIELVKKYLTAQFIPSRYIDDMNHIAIASVHNIDVLLSWNLRHLVKLKTKRYVNSINMTEGYKSMEILTPQEVVDNDPGTEGSERDP